MTQTSSPRLLDHIVLSVAHVDTARARFEALGFTVAPTGLHPFGTENCCIFLEDDTFLEPLGIAQRETCEAQAIAGNAFVANDQAYRFRRGLEGFSSLVIKSNDAKADHRIYRKLGMSGGRRLKFSRTFETPAGETGKVSFKLAFAADQRSPDSYFFSCQVVGAPKIDRSALKRHSNGAVSMREVIASEPNPTDFQYFMQVFLNQRHMDVDSFGMSFETGNGTVSVLSPDGMKAFYGMDCERFERGMRFQAIVVGVDSIAKTRDELGKNFVEFSERSNRLIVPPAPGQGATIMFEEA